MRSIKTPTLKVRRNFVPWNRNWHTVKRHAPVLFKPVMAALLAVIIWKYFLHDQHIFFGTHLENPLLFLVMPLVAFVYVIFASIAVDSVFKEYKTISRCVVKSDLETFLLHRDEQLPIMMHILVGAPSIILVLLSMLLHYNDLYIGIASVFCVVFVVVLTWFVVTELDDYEKSIWFREKIPTHWFEVDVEAYFSEQRAESIKNALKKTTKSP